MTSLATAAINNSPRDVLTLSITGILVVLSGLFLLSLVVAQFKRINRDSAGKEIASTKSEPAEPEESKNSRISFEDDEMTAIVAALTIEMRLYYDEEIGELPFTYEPKQPSNWANAARAER